MQEDSSTQNLLAQIKKTQAKERGKRGRLKIFFGYAAGVGKTFAMLEEARELKNEGYDVVIGYLEPHDRPETAQLAEGLEQLPPKRVQHQGLQVNEFDLEAALKRKPTFILVDELAHSNVDDQKHSKRYQDIAELLNAGINVYSTLNVQHLESLNSVIDNLLHVAVTETVPDYIFDNADEIKLVDLEPKDLTMRLQLGKIYSTVHARKALNNFFKMNNLTYLRELALRKMTMRLAHRKKASERLLVCISGAPSNRRVIRTAAQLAHAFSCELSGIYISDDQDETAHSQQLTENIRLAELLGAKVATLYGAQKGELIAEYAREKEISKIVLGASQTTWLEELWREDIVEQLNTLIPEIDKFVITEKKHRKKRKKLFSVSLNQVANLSDLLKIFAILTGCSFLGLLLKEIGSNDVNIVLLYILGVMINALVTHGKRYSLFYSFAMLLLYDFLFTQPLASFQSSPNNLLTFVVMFLVAFLSSSWTTKLRKQGILDAQRAYRTEILLKTNRLLQRSPSLAEIYQVTGEQLRELLKCPVCIFPGNQENLSMPHFFGDGKDNQATTITTAEQAIVLWVLRNRKRAGFGTDTLPKADYLHLPLNDPEEPRYALAVVSLGLKKSVHPDSFTLDLAYSICDECEQAVLRIKNLKQKNEGEALARQEKLRANLLRGISHDLRTPLTTISGNADILLHSEYELEETQRKELYHSIYNDATWLINLVENLLAMTKVDEGSLKVKRRPELVEDIFQAALSHLSANAVKHTLETKIESQMLILDTDGQLITQVLINIINNAIQYTPTGSKIILTANSTANGRAQISIYNDGPHIDEQAMTKIFELFYSGNSIYAGRKGMGIGLALCKSIIAACGGRLEVENVQPKGVRFFFTLPLWRDKDE
ncbi:ATP-binding protein [Liquorilactobacillus satsumensis]|uniref:ATP-binding protein n=1 Tax=Liquorilactobacillus satsumensis TaxID=259059 RepID=UPI0039E87C3B